MENVTFTKDYIEKTGTEASKKITLRR